MFFPLKNNVFVCSQLKSCDWWCYPKKVVTNVIFTMFTVFEGIGLNRANVKIKRSDNTVVVALIFFLMLES